MEKWLTYGADQVDAMARMDPEYRSLSESQQALVPEFDRLMEGLPREQRELILEYLNLSVDMEYRKTQLVWNYKKPELL